MTDHEVTHSKKVNTPLDLKYRYRGVKGHYSVEFSIGNQTFTLRHRVETIKMVRWYHKMLHYALCNLLQASDQKRLLVHLKTTRHIYHVTRSNSKRTRKSNKPKKSSRRS